MTEQIKKTQIKIFTNKFIDDIEKDVNKFVGKNEIIDIKFQYNGFITVLIIYK